MGSRLSYIRKDHKYSDNMKNNEKEEIEFLSLEDEKKKPVNNKKKTKQSEEVKKKKSEKGQEHQGKIKSGKRKATSKGKKEKQKGEKGSLEKAQVKTKKTSKVKKPIRRKKKIQIIFLVFVGVLCFSTIYLTVIQRSLVKSELQQLEKDIQNSKLNYDDIKKRANKTITVGPYKKVEIAYKKYVNDVVSTTKEINKLTEKENLSNILSSKNLKEDGPKFVVTQKYIDETWEKLQKNLTFLIKLMQKDTIMSYIKDKKVSTSQKKLYEEVALKDENQLEKMQKSLEENLTYYKNMFKVFQEAIHFLSTHKNWKIENNKLIFSSNNEYKKYNEIVKGLK